MCVCPPPPPGLHSSGTARQRWSRFISSRLIPGIPLCSLWQELGSDFMPSPDASKNMAPAQERATAPWSVALMATQKQWCPTGVDGQAPHHLLQPDRRVTAHPLLRCHRHTDRTGRCSLRQGTQAHTALQHHNTCLNRETQRGAPCEGRGPVGVVRLEYVGWGPLSLTSGWPSPLGGRVPICKNERAQCSILRRLDTERPDLLLLPPRLQKRTCPHAMLPRFPCHTTSIVYRMPPLKLSPFPLVLPP